MENYIVSARKYRPDNFESVVGQDSITLTLKNSIKINQLAQAYLFCGPRGVGKTTCARIFAKTINCSNLSPDYEACNECESCVAFNKLRSLNIHELDAASNNSVDDIRNLIDQVRIPPQLGSYSVYIIDEVHMLSSAAFNAFLKTLEEPPRHVIFILATTEKHKILPTILSRCQIFDFNRISVEDIRSRLEFVAQRENIEAEHDALHIIAQKADGAMRDALSIFDQIVSFSGKNITYDSTIKNLNVLDYDTYFKITKALTIGDYVQALKIFDSVLRRGFEASYFISGLASHFRDLLIVKDPGTVDLIEVGKKIKQEYIQNSQTCSVSFLFQSINITNTADLNYKQSQNKRLLVELALLNICNIEKPIIDNKAASEPKKIEEKESTTETPKAETNIDDNKPTQAEETKIESTNVEKTEVQKSAPVSETENSKNIIRGVSLKNLSKESTKPQISENGEPVVDYSGVGNEEYDYDKLIYVWTKYAETFASNPRLYSFLTGHLPIQTEGYNYKVTVDTQLIKDKLDSFKHDTIKFMRTGLNNKNFELEYEIGEGEKKIAYKTDEEKLQDMINQNPDLKKLKDQLNLDFE